MFFKPTTPPYRSVLFVCTANITRSTTAEALFRAYTNNMYDKWKVSSAGVNALTRRFPQLGETPHTAVLSYLRERKNIHNYMHNSQQISKKLLHQYYWIIVMETAHKEFIDKLGVPLETRMFTMREFGLITPPKELDMPDPTGGPDRNHYLSKFDIIDKEIPRIFDVLTNNIFQLENPDY